MYIKDNNYEKEIKALNELIGYRDKAIKARDITISNLKTYEQKYWDCQRRIDEYERELTEKNKEIDALEKKNKKILSSLILSAYQNAINSELIN